MSAPPPSLVGSLRARFDALALRFGWSDEALTAMQERAGAANGASTSASPSSPPAAPQQDDVDENDTAPFDLGVAGSPTSVVSGRRSTLVASKPVFRRHSVGIRSSFWEEGKQDSGDDESDDESAVGQTEEQNTVDGADVDAGSEVGGEEDNSDTDSVVGSGAAAAPAQLVATARKRRDVIYDSDEDHSEDDADTVVVLSSFKDRQRIKEQGGTMVIGGRSFLSPEDVEDVMEGQESPAHKNRAQGTTAGKRKLRKQADKKHKLDSSDEGGSDASPAARQPTQQRPSVTAAPSTVRKRLGLADVVFSSDEEDEQERDGDDSDSDEDEEEEDDFIVPTSDEDEEEDDEDYEEGKKANKKRKEESKKQEKAAPGATKARRGVICDDDDDDDDDEFVDDSSAAAGGSGSGSGSTPDWAKTTKGHTATASTAKGKTYGGSLVAAGSNNGSSAAKPAKGEPTQPKGKGKAAAPTAAASSAPRDGDIDPTTGLVWVAEEHMSPEALDDDAFEAPRFRNKKNRDAMTAALFNEYNRRVFGNALPSGTIIEWNPRLTKTAGLTYSARRRATGDMALALEESSSSEAIAAGGKGGDGGAGGSAAASASDDWHPSAVRQRADGLVYRARIELSTKVLNTPRKLAQTLLHEMCHAAAWIVDGTNTPPHGQVFGKWASAGTRAYPNRTVTTCHTYELSYRYHYTCQLCAYVYGRHSKSIDVVAMRCGRCQKGVLVLRDLGAAGRPKPKLKPYDPEGAASKASAAGAAASAGAGAATSSSSAGHDEYSWAGGAAMMMTGNEQQENDERGARFASPTGRARNTTTTTTTAKAGAGATAAARTPSAYQAFVSENLSMVRATMLPKGASAKDAMRAVAQLWSEKKSRDKGLLAAAGSDSNVLAAGAMRLGGSGSGSAAIAEDDDDDIVDLTGMVESGMRM